VGHHRDCGGRTLVSQMARRARARRSSGSGRHSPVIWSSSRSRPALPRGDGQLRRLSGAAFSSLPHGPSGSWGPKLGTPMRGCRFYEWVRRRPMGRRWGHARAWYYCVNTSPWLASVTAALPLPSTGILASNADRAGDPIEMVSSGLLVWTSMPGGRVTSPGSMNAGAVVLNIVMARGAIGCLGHWYGTTHGLAEPLTPRSICRISLTGNAAPNPISRSSLQLQWLRGPSPRSLTRWTIPEGHAQGPIIGVRPRHRGRRDLLFSLGNLDGPSATTRASACSVSPTPCRRMAGERSLPSCSSRLPFLPLALAQT